jgi:hypothetical protein
MSSVSPEPTPKTNVGSLFTKQMNVLKEHNLQEEQAILNQDASRWYRPADWDKSAFDIASYHKPFLREQQENEFIKAVTNPEDSGTTGDMVMVTVQGDFMQTLERAFRERMCGSVRNRIQAAGRKMGHGHDQGVIKEGLHGYVVNVDRLNKGENV